MDLLLWAPLGNADGVSAKTEKGVEDRAAAPQAHRLRSATTREGTRLTRVIPKAIHRAMTDRRKRSRILGSPRRVNRDDAQRSRATKLAEQR